MCDILPEVNTATFISHIKCTNFFIKLEITE